MSCIASKKSDTLISKWCIEVKQLCPNKNKVDTHMKQTRFTKTITLCELLASLRLAWKTDESWRRKQGAETRRCNVDG